jgi:hypothetical protein
MKVGEGHGAGKGWARLPAMDPAGARRLLLDRRPERWYASDWTAAYGPPPAWDAVVADLRDREALALAVLSRLGDDPVDPFGENSPGRMPRAVGEVDPGATQAIFEALSRGFPPVP